ncbi:hypothetical protein [Haloarchaeobius sp. HRN-SO-5]|uniref:hypothetical protein n=1 Tax=Haloarchaeobius sp. HRN-SO-5 TaxID=3446118 RepID=UPI003EBC6E6C
MADTSAHDTKDLLVRFGRRADRPSTAAAVVATTAVVFSGLWFLLVWIPAAYVVDIVDIVDVMGLYLLTVANAYVVPYAVWRWLFPVESWSYRRGLAAGVAIGIVSHLAIGYVWLVWSWLVEFAFGPEAILPFSGFESLVIGGLLVSYFSVQATFGLPIALSVGAAVWLTYCRRRSTGGRARS